MKIKYFLPITTFLIFLTLFLVIETSSATTFLPDFEKNPYELQVSEQIEKLQSTDPWIRAGAAEALGYLRSYGSAQALVKALSDNSALVRREAAVSLAWCSGRSEVTHLLAGLYDEEWIVAQSSWASLTNITGMEFPFDALADQKIKDQHAEAWYKWWASIPGKTTPKEVLELVSSKDREEILRGVRALGAIGHQDNTDLILKVLLPYLKRDYGDLDFLDKHIIQSCIRSLGRLRDPNTFQVLLDILKTTDWARYAADALGDFGSKDAVEPLIKAYKLFARPLRSPLRSPKIVPDDDEFTGDNMQDRMLETPFTIASALIRLPLDNKQDIKALREIGPLLISNLPSDWDGAMFYDIESDQLVTAWLLEKSGIRQAAINAAFKSTSHTEKWVQLELADSGFENLSEMQVIEKLASRIYGDVPYMAAWIPAFCRENDVPKLIKLLEHDNGWIRINAAKSLMFIGTQDAVEPIAELLEKSHPEADYGFSGALEHAEYDDPAPRWREAFIYALGRLGATQHTQLLVSILENDHNVLENQYAAALALEELGTQEAYKALSRAEAGHPFHSIRLIAREALWRKGTSQRPRTTIPFQDANGVRENYQSLEENDVQKVDIVFIKGDREVRSNFNGQAGVDPWRQTYVISNSGPSMRVGRNLYILSQNEAGGKVRPLTTFEDGFVADCEVSWDGTKIIFARRLNGEDRNYEEMPYEKAGLKSSETHGLGSPEDPWWHIWEINIDGTNLKQLTFGPYHDVAPVYLPDDRIVFSSSRIGVRDEYHGYPAPGLTVMNADGSDIHPIGFNLGADRDPSILNDGRIAFSRLDIFYSRLKTEVTLQTVLPDGTRNAALYGPERRPFWKRVHVNNSAWTIRESYEDNPDNRNRVLRLAQPQGFPDGRVVCASSGGLVLCGHNPYEETLVPHDRKMAVTSPYPIDDQNILCAATPKRFKVEGKIYEVGTKDFESLEKGPELFMSAIDIDLALYRMNVETGEMTLVYNDPDTADFEARPIVARKRPQILAENHTVRNETFTAKLFCNSARNSRIPRVQSRGRFVRVVEGQPVLSRHQTHQNRPLNDLIKRDQRWKNHGATKARILGTFPMAYDGSFFIEVPADRLLHMQVLDSDRRVIGNQVFWMYARPGETLSCTGCHEPRNRTALNDHYAYSATREPVKILPYGGEFTYLAKSWIKGWLPDEIEERTRTVHAINLLGRH